MLVINDRVAGMMHAAPTPMSARAPMSTPADDAVAATIDPAPKSASPMLRKRSRPNRSPSAPAVSSSPANTRMYTSTIHCSSLADAPRPPAAVGRARVGRATLRIELSMPMIVSVRQSTISAYQRRPCAYSGSRSRSRTRWSFPSASALGDGDDRRLLELDRIVIAPRAADPGISALGADCATIPRRS